MRRIAREGDMVTCGVCADWWSPIDKVKVMRTFVNNRRVATQFDEALSCRVAVLIEASKTVFIENQRVHRMYDKNTCQGLTLTASADTFIDQ